MMKGFRLINHTADVGIEAEGKTLEDLFINAVGGLYYILFGESPPHTPENVSENISLDAPDTETLLVEWLNEILYHAVSHKRYFDKINLKISDLALSASLNGVVLDCCFKHEVKSATYHDLKIVKTASGYKVKVIFDL